MSAITTALWGLPTVCAFVLLILLIKSQDRFAAITRTGWTRMITGSVFVLLFSVTLFMLHLPVIHMFLGQNTDRVALAAYLVFALGLVLMIPAAVGWLSDISAEKSKNDERISSASLTEDLLTVSEQPYVLTELLVAGLGTLIRHVEAQAGMVWMLSPDRVTLVLAGSHGFDKPTAKAAEQIQASGHELLDRALQGKGVVTAGDLSARSRFLSTFPGMDQFASIAVIPLLGGGELIGVALLASNTPYHFGPELVRTLEGAGRILGHAVANQRLERLLRKSERREVESRRAVSQWDHITGEGMPLSTPALLAGLAEASESKAAFLVSRAGRFVEHATSTAFVGLPMEGIWSEAQAVSDQKQRALWVNPGGRTQDPRAGLGRWIVLATPAGHLFLAPRRSQVSFSTSDLSRFAKGAELALLLAETPDRPEPENLLSAGAELARSGVAEARLAELVADVVTQAEAVLVWKRSEGRLRVAGVHGCDAAPLATVQVPAGQGSVGKAALAGLALRMEAQAELGRSWLEYSESDRHAFTEAFGGLERPMAEYVVPVGNSDRILHLIRFTRGGFSDASVHLADSVARMLQVEPTPSALPKVSAEHANDLNNVFTGIIGQAELLHREWTQAGLPERLAGRLAQIIETAQTGSDLVGQMAPVEPDSSGLGLDVLTQDLLSGRHITDDLYLLPDNSSVQVQRDLSPTPDFDGDQNRLRDLMWNVLQWVARDRQQVTLGTSSDERYTYLVAGSGERAEPLKGPYGDYFKAPDTAWTRLLPASDLDFLRLRGAQLAANEVEEPRRLVVRFPHRPSARPGRVRSVALRVLAIDDQEIIRDLLLNMFMGMGHEIRVCRSGEEGLAALDEASFDLVLTDLGMPGMSGWEVAAAVKKRSPATPVILITGWGFNFAEEQVRKAGVDYVLTKPFRLEHLTEVVEAAVRRTPQVH